MTLHPAGEAGRRSASYFRDSLGRQLDQVAALASSVAEDWGSDGEGGGHGGLGNGMGIRPGFSPAYRRPDGGRLRNGPGAVPPMGKTAAGAMAGTVHGHEVEAYGPPELAGKKLYDPLTATLGGGLGATSATFGPHMHEGIDLMAPVGTPTYSPMEGKITKIGRDRWGQTTVTIQHPNGVYSRFLHQHGANVRVGDAVKGGQQIGTSGFANAAHTHFEMWHGAPGRGSKLMNAKAIYGWDKNNLPQGGREVTALGAGGKPGETEPGTAAGKPPVPAPPAPAGFAPAAPGTPITGDASTYNPYKPGWRGGGGRTASGEPYDPQAWTAAIQTGQRHKFGGVGYGKDYQPSYALVEHGDKQAIVRINDVGPLTRGRVIDLNERSMRYFDPTAQKGVLPGVKVTPLAGANWTPGPVTPRAPVTASQQEPNP